MRIAAVTMLFGEYEFLRRWYDHFGAMVGHENLYIVSHGGDPKHAKIAPKASIIKIPRFPQQEFNQVRQKALGNLQLFLNGYYDVIMRTDVDELVFFDPEMHSSIEDCLASVDARAWYGLGFNLIEMPGEAEVDWSKPVSLNRKTCMIAALYSKAVAAQGGIRIKFHGATGPKDADPKDYKLVPGLYLAHLKYTDTKLLDVSNETRKDMSSKERHGKNAYIASEAWTRPDTFTNAHLAQMRAAPRVEAEEELKLAFEHIGSGMRRSGVRQQRTMKAPSWKANGTFVLPDRLVGQF